MADQTTTIIARPWTPDRRNEDGSTTVTVKRCCNGCGRKLGDASLIEIDAAVFGQPLPDVRGECPDCCPVHSPAAPPDQAEDGSGEPACRVCGCTDNAACPGGCWWVPDPTKAGNLCSACAPEVAHA